MAGESRRDLIYRMRVEADQARAEWLKTAGATRQMRAELRALEQQQRAVDDAMTMLGVGTAAAGASIAVGLGLATRAAVGWESAWTGVAKVVDGTPEQMADLEEELRGLATTLPQTHAEIAEVAAAAGQLGIAREDIAQFTETMVAMGVSTDLSSEQAAMGMARLMNIMQTSTDDVDRLGAAIVGLGNSGASTEGEILDMALRLAGAGHTIGLTEDEVLALSSALASVGVEAESGGSSISTAMIMMSEAVNEGGDSLDRFARVAGVTADEFATQFRTDPAAAIDAFVQGLGRIQATGGDTFAIMEGLGMSEIRLRDNMLRLAGAGDLLHESLATGAAAWDENEALMAEAERRYGTTEAQIAIAKNQITDMGITIGETLLPAVNTLLDVGSGMFSWFQSLPPSVQEAVTWLGVAAAAIALAGGASLIAIPKFHALNQALGDMGTGKAALAQKALNGVSGVLMGPWGLAITGAVAVLGLFVGAQAKTQAETDELTATFDEQTGAITTNTRAWIANKLEEEGAFESAKQLGISQSELVDAVISGNDVIAEQRQELAELRAVSEGARGGVNDLTDEQEQQGRAVDDLDHHLGNLQDQYTEAAAAAENKRLAVEGDITAMEDASGATQVYADHLNVTATAAEDAKGAVQQLDEALQQIMTTLFGVEEAEDAVATLVNEITGEFEENGFAIEGNTEAAIKHREMLRNLIAAYMDQVVAVAEATGSQEEAQATAEDLKDDFRALAKQLGLTDAEIEDYVAALDEIPSVVETTIKTRYVTTGAPPTIPKGGQSPAIMADGGFVGFADGGHVHGFPAGGFIRGAGGPRSDSIPAMLSNGEFVVNAAATRMHRPVLEAINAGRTTAAALNATRYRSGGSSMDVNVLLNFIGSSEAMTRWMQDIVKVEADGVVQNAFGSR